MSLQRRISILGSTGSVGKAALDVIRRANPNDARFSVVSLTANENAEELASQAIAAGASFAAIGNADRYQDLKSALAGSGVTAAAGATGLNEAAAIEADTVVSAIVGVAGLSATMAAVNAGSTIALANKESMVCAGALLQEAASKKGTKILPIDSEHNAIFQVLDRRERVEKVTLTASGGPFRSSTLEQMKRVTPKEALRHPNWSMGSKITIDSATMMNKGLELIEAAYLFELTNSQLDVLVHPSSIVHSLVSYDDGSVLAQLGQPDMRIPISYALAWPERMSMPAVKRLDLATIGRLEFYPPDHQRFPALTLAREALKVGGVYPIVLNASNEIAVEAFLQGRIGFLGIAACVERALDEATKSASKAMAGPLSLEDILDVDAQARAYTRERIESLATVSQ